ncbi:MAG: Lrp/AsnC family transcriptional regulator [Planctomycetes bacterium]|nr:Lrp/AsnC family transcriptional regulator [Planctomycetota bacterium]
MSELLAAADLDKRLLTDIQKELPLAERPFAEVARRLGAGETEVLEALRRLKAEKVIRQLGAIFDTRRLGYQSALCALRVPPDQVDAAGAAVSGHPGVSHNYGRAHAYNLWFTLALPPGVDFAAAVAGLARKAGALDAMLLPMLRQYKLGVKLDVTGEEGGADEGAVAAANSASAVGGGGAAPPRRLSAREIDIVREAQEPLALEPEPWAPVAARVGLPVGDLLTQLRQFAEEGILRRVAAVLHHRAAGFKANVMGVWAAPDERCDEFGALMAGFRAVSHCYRRPTFPQWPFNLFTMVHGRDAAECDAVLREIAERTGIAHHDRLFSVKEYKKVRLKYFSRELDAWRV